MIDLESLSKKELIDKLNEANEKLSVLMDSIPGGFLSYDKATGRFDVISKGTLAMFGLTQEQFRDRFYNSFEMLIDKNDRSKVLESIEAQLQYFDTVEATYRVNDVMRTTPMWIYHKARLLHCADGRTLFYVVLNDVSDEKLIQESVSDITQQLYTKAEKDGMTGLFKKESMQEQIKQYLSEAPDEQAGAMMMIDTDNFKAVNDTFGHAYGDDIIKFVAGAIKSSFRSDDLCARMGGDEFMVFLKAVSVEEAEKRAGILNDKIRCECVYEGKSVNISCSIGISYFPSDGKDYDSLFKAADAALYIAKENGKDQFRSFCKGVVE